MSQSFLRPPADYGVGAANPIRGTATGTLYAAPQAVHGVQVAAADVAQLTAAGWTAYAGTAYPVPIAAGPVQATTANAPKWAMGAMYHDLTLNKLRIGGASGWETVTSA
jgi:hypothetical protein